MWQLFVKIIVDATDHFLTNLFSESSCVVIGGMNASLLIQLRFAQKRCEDVTHRLFVLTISQSSQFDSRRLLLCSCFRCVKSFEDVTPHSDGVIAFTGIGFAFRHRFHNDLNQLRQFFVAVQRVFIHPYDAFSLHPMAMCTLLQINSFTKIISRSFP